MNRIMKLASYAAAPKLTFAARHPTKAAMAKAGKWALDSVRPERRTPAYGKMALKGLGAAALALPIGLWLGRKVRGGRIDSDW